MKKLKRIVASLLAVLMLLGVAPVTALAGEIELHRINTMQQPAEEPAQEPVLSSEDVLPEEDVAEAAEPAAVSSGSLDYRIVHLDCGRKYFSVEYIKSVIDTMAENGFNQLELAFGNGGLRFVLDNMDIKSGSSTLHNSEDVKAAIRQGNERFYNDPNGNSLTETDMKAIITYAQSKGVEIVPLLNMPGHMDGVLSSDLFSQYKLSGSEGSLDLNNSYAVDFGKALLKLYVDWFRQNSNSKFFNFGADEYGQGIRNPYIESSVAKVTYDQLINYMNDCADIIEGQSMTARCFNDFVCYNRRTDCNLYKTVQVCYWSNQWNNSEYNTPDVIKNAGYKMINTNQKWYFVPSKADEYGKNVVLNNFTTFDVTKYQNIKYGYNPTSTTYTEIPVGTTNVGAMFCVWCDTPSVDVALADVQDLIAAMATANPNYFTKGTTPTTPTIQDDNGHDSIFEIIINALLRIFLPEGTTATWTVTEGTDVVELVADDAAAAQTRSAEPAAAAETAAITGNAVQVRALKAGTATITATLDDGTPVTATVTVKDNTQETITVTKGQTFEKIIDGKYDGEHATANPEVATVTAEYTPTAGGTYYDKATLKAETFYISDINNDAAPTVTVTFEDAGGGEYYIKRNSDGKYIYPDVSYRAIYGWTYSLGTADSQDSAKTVTIKAQNGGVVISRSGWRTTYLTLNDNNFGARGSSKTLYIYTQRTEKGDPKTKLTFTGLKAGTTTVTIAGVEYTINVVPEDLSNVTLPVNLWITNTGVVPTGWSNGTPSEFTYSDTDGNRRSIYTLKANYQGVYSENGIALNSILPATSGTAKSWDKNTYDVVYWKSAYHTAEKRQSTDGWTNNSHLGTEFTYIRYWDGSWAYSVDGSTWVNIENVGAEAADTEKNQVNLWYRQKTEITTEVETQIVDWGPVSYSANQCLLDFAVKYESGEQVPSSFPVTGKTMGFDCPTNQAVPLGNGYVVQDTDGAYYRTVYGIAGVETAEYEVYMITLKPSSDTHSEYITKGTRPTSYPYNGTEKIAWAKTEEDADSSELAVISNVKYGGEPFLESVKIYQYQGLLVTYYVRAKETADSLKVHYINRSNNNEEFYNYSIAVDKGTTFDSRFALVSGQLNQLQYNTVVNKKGETQTVLADLKTMPQIAAQYRYSNYTCVEVNRSDDGKEVFLYYTFNSTQTFVVDFGLPLVIKPTDMNSSLGDDGVTIEKVEIAKVSTYADITVDENKNIVYKLNQMISGHDNFGAKYTGNRITAEGEQNSTVEYSVTIIPATTVYYEDSFVDFYDAGSSAKKTAFTQTTESDAMGEWYVEGNANTTAEQALSKLGDKAIYGYDPAYNNSTMFSMDSAKKVTVNTNGQYAQAKFTFKGTGFDVISLTNSDSGAITVEVLKDGTTAKTKDGKDAFYLVNNYYGYKQENGQWVVDPTATNTLYQIPVMKVSGLDYGTYTAVITVDYAEFFDKTNDNKYSFWLDAIRIYDPMGVDNETYTKDDEGFPQYIKLHDAVKAGATEALFIDGAASADVATYANFGPNNEVYLASGQAISFKLNIQAGTQIASVQIGAKAPNGNAAKLVVNGGELKEIATATEMYYEISKDGNGNFTVTNTGTGILSLTNLKITYSAKGSVSLAAMSAEEQTSAVMMVRAMFAPPAPTVFEPETFTVSLKNYKDVYVREYIKVTVTTSDDVKYITVGDKKISRYDDERVWGGFRKGFVKTGKRVWSYYVSFDTAGQQVISVVAYDADGLASEAVENTVNIKPRSAWRGKTSEWHI